MGIRIYQSGAFLTIEQPSGNITNLPLANYVALFVDSDNVQFSTFQDGATVVVPAQVSTLENQIGNLIGNAADVQAYLAAMSVPSGGVNQDLGFALFTDTINDQLNPQNIVAGVPQQLTIVSNAPLIRGGTNFQAIAPSLWSANKINPDNGNSDSYLIRLSFVVDPDSNNTSIFVHLDIGTTSLLSETSIALPANRNTESAQTIIMDVFAGANFLTNGGSIMMDGDGDYSIYNKTIKIEKIRKT